MFETPKRDDYKEAQVDRLPLSLRSSGHASGEPRPCAGRPEQFPGSDHVLGLPPLAPVAAGLAPFCAAAVGGGLLAVAADRCATRPAERGGAHRPPVSLAHRGQRAAAARAPPPPPAAAPPPAPAAAAAVGSAGGGPGAGAALETAGMFHRFRTTGHGCLF